MLSNRRATELDSPSEAGESGQNVDLISEMFTKRGCLIFSKRDDDCVFNVFLLTFHTCTFVLFSNVKSSYFSAILFSVLGILSSPWTALSPSPTANGRTKIEKDTLRGGQLNDGLHVSVS